jgi:arsenate reductase (thioredoxin)
MKPTVLFLCPHHAAKSVLAEAYFNRLANEAGLSWQAASAGTEPDEKVAPVVVTLLGQQGIDVSGHQPRRVTADELESATRIVSMGCTPEELDIPAAQVEQWTDIPPVSQNPEGASAAIQAHIRELVEQLRMPS